ncbi:MAG: sulfatase-like hydrolase/transferase [Bacteroidales bacterium]|nr:sulfatase-like hydrolase/transferase [Bacteroidales bacterium]
MKKWVKKINDFIPHHLKVIFKIYASGIILFTILRLILFFATLNQLPSIQENNVWIMMQAFFMGWRFDTVISGYILMLPIVILSVGELFRKHRKYFVGLVKIFIITLYILAFLICFADIPFYIQFGNRFNMSAFQWLDSPVFVIQMIVSEYRYWLAAVPFILFSFLWFKWVNFLFRNYSNKNLFWNIHSKRKGILIFSIASILFMGITFLGIRGRMEQKSPIRIGTAFFSPYPYANQLGLNPVFTLMRSWLDTQKSENQEIHYISDEQAIAIMQKHLGVDTLINESPIARARNSGLKPLNYNVVVIIMESMGAQNMARFGNSENFTPVLDDLATKSICFDQAYTTGIHTYNGIFSSLFAFPAIPQKHTFNDFPINIYSGLSGILKENGYQTLFFIPHDDQFDNLGGFLTANHFDDITSQKHYPKEKVISNLGVPDHIMFEFAVEKISQKSLHGKPFLAAFMTASNHGPYIFPSDIALRPKSSDVKKQMIEYSDWAIGQFLTQASKQTWFDSTIFVFVADHGFNAPGPHEIPLSYHHTPFLIYAPAIIDSIFSSSEIASQMDIFPTLMGMLKIPFVNNTLGVDLLNENRDYAIVANNNSYGVISKEWFLVVREDGNTLFYNILENNILSLSNKETQTIMKEFAQSNYQITQYLTKHKLSGIK